MSGALRTLLLTAGIAAAYVVAARIGFSLAFAVEQVTAVWPPTGIAIAALCFFGARGAGGIALGAFIANAMTSAPLPTALAIALGNTAAPLAGWWLLRRAGFDERLARVRDVLALTGLASAAAMSLSASNGVLQLYAAGLIGAAQVPGVFGLWWAGDAMGVLLLSPLILTWLRRPVAHVARPRLVETVLFALGLGGAIWASFLGSVPLAYPVFPLVIWSALRFGQRGTALTVVVVAGIAVWATAHGLGPFVEGGQDQRLILLVTFMAIVAVTGLLLGAVTAERATAQASLEQARQGLEERVADRTRALSQANGELVSTNQALTRRTNELAHKSEEVEAFVYIVSHDLRAPLVNLQGFARELEIGCDGLGQALRQAQLSPELAARVNAVLDEDIGTARRYIAASVTKFERLIGALLSLSRTGQQSYRIETLDTRKLVDETLDALRQSVLDSRAQIEIDALPPVQGDATAIGQVFGNLLSNALKYRDPQRPLRIRIGGAPCGELAEFRVGDTGAGIPAEATRRLFQVFQRFHPDRAAGDGIGLAAVKRIVERHGGTIRAESHAGQGSTFIFTLRAASPLP